MKGCGVTLTKAWTFCQRPAVFPDGRCSLHTAHLDGSVSSRNAQLREVIRSGLSALGLTRPAADSSPESPPASHLPERCP